MNKTALWIYGVVIAILSVLVLVQPWQRTEISGGNERKPRATGERQLRAAGNLPQPAEIAPQSVGSANPPGGAAQANSDSPDPLQLIEVMNAPQGDYASRENAWKRFMAVVGSMSKDDVLGLMGRAGGIPNPHMRGETLLLIIGAVRGEVAQDAWEFMLKHHPPSTQFRYSFQIAAYVGERAKSDAASMCRWIDHLVAEGYFPNKGISDRNEMLVFMELELTKRFLSEGRIDDAGRRLALLSDDEKKSVLGNYVANEREDSTLKAWVRLVDGSVGAEVKSELIGQRTRDMSSDFARVDRFLAVIEATGEHLAVGARQAAISRLSSIARERELRADDVEMVRGWLGTHGVGDWENTGMVLARAINVEQGLSLEKSIEIITRFHAENRDDSTLKGFVSGLKCCFPAEARIIAGGIRDAELRKQALEELE